MNTTLKKWNSHYSNQADKIPEPSKFLIQSIPMLQPGSVLDIASGDGASALFLASQGFNTTALDISDVALQRLNSFSQKLNLNVTTINLDLDSDIQLNTLGQFNNLVVTRFKPQKSLWSKLIQQLSPEGMLLVSTFNQHHAKYTRFPIEYCLAPEELLQLSPGLKVVHYESESHNAQHIDNYLFKRISG